MKSTIVSECHKAGLLCGIWDAAVEYDTAARVASGFDCYIGQIEGPGQYDRCLANLASFRAAHPAPFPAGIVSNTGGFEEDYPGAGADKALPFINADFFIITETHINEEGGVDSTEGRLDYAKRVLGWPGPQPMGGLGNGASLSQYPTLQTHSGWSVFAAEELL